MNLTKRPILAVCIMASAALRMSAAEVVFRGIAETGFLSVLGHKIQFGKSGTYFDYVDNGGQDVLFPVTRISAEADIGKKNTIILLYQPLNLETKDLLKRDVVVDGATFRDSAGIQCRYSFPFYRASYLRELMAINGRGALAFGLSLQIRNATISFESTGGSDYRTNRDVGIVPALKLRGVYHFAGRYFAGIEADGIYAPVSYLNGSDNEVVGAILDASLRAGAKVRSGTLFINARYLGGGATGTSTKNTWPGDGYVKNWLHFLLITAGAIHEF